jgi:hypothetical protein
MLVTILFRLSSSHLLSRSIKIKIYKTIILPVDLYGCETWSHTGEEHGLRVSENRLLRRIFAQKREERAREWRRLHNEKFHNLYASPNITQVIKSRRLDGWGMTER